MIEKRLKNIINTYKHTQIYFTSVKNCTIYNIIKNTICIKKVMFLISQYNKFRLVNNLLSVCH